MRFKTWVGAEDADEFWLIQFSGGGSWSRDWLTRQAVELADVDAQGGCCGGGLFLLEVRDQKTQWGASAAVVDVLLTLAQDQLSNLTWAALGALAHRMATRRKQNTQGVTYEDDLSDAEVRESAMYAVVRFRGLKRADLTVRSVETLDGGAVRVEVQDVSGALFTVEVEGHSAGVLSARVRKVTEL